MPNEDKNGMTKEDAQALLQNRFLPFLDKVGLTGSLAARKHKAELNARELKLVKIKGFCYNNILKSKDE